MSEITLEVEVREKTGKGAGRSLRRAGKVPAVVYGKTVEPVGLQIDTPTVQRLLQSGASGGLIRLKYNGNNQMVLLKDVQLDPVMGTPVHVDFHAIALDQEVQVDVPIVLVGEDQRVNDGGVLAQNLRELAISCLPTAIPESISVDVSGLETGNNLTVGDLELPEGVSLRVEPEEVVLSIVLPRGAAEDDAEADAEEAAEGAEGSDQGGSDDDAGSDSE